MQAIEALFTAPPIIENVFNGWKEYQLGKLQAEQYLSKAIFPLASVTDESKERMIKLSATTLLMQRLNCELMGVTSTPKLEDKFLLIGAIIDPYDGAIDSDLDSSLRYCSDLFSLFDSEQPLEKLESTDPTINRFYSYFYLLLQEIPTPEYPGFWKTLKAMHMIQIISLLQRRDAQERLDLRLSKEELFELSSIKGGLNAILFAALINPLVANNIPEIDFPPKLSALELEGLWHEYVKEGCLYVNGNDDLADVMYQAGSFIQHVDDFEDAPDDKRKGIETAFTVDQMTTLQFLGEIPAYFRTIGENFISSGISEQDAKKLLTYMGLFTLRKIKKRFEKIPNLV